MSEWKRQEGEETIFRTCAWSPPGCHPVGCGLQVHVKDGVVTEVEGDPEHPITKGSLCPRCLALTEYIYHPDRIVHPMKRAREDRGLDKWEQCSWDEATDLVANAALEITEKYGAETICVFGGTGREANNWYPQWANLVFGTPNSIYAQAGWSCYGPRMSNTAFMIGGGYPEIDYAQKFDDRYDHEGWVPPEVIVLWGKEPLRSNPDGLYGHAIVEMMRKFGTKLICVDPRITWLSSRADYHLRVRPGTDAALAMAMLNTIIQEDLYDHDFVEYWCYGFEQLAERVAEMPAEKAGEICGIDPAYIKDAARMYANAKPASLQWGLAFDQSTNGMQLSHCAICLMALTANIDVPGGQILGNANSGQNETGFGFEEALGKDLISKMIGLKEYPAYANTILDAHADLTLKAMETGEPYPIKMGFYAGNNLMSCTSMEPKRWHDAMVNTLEFCFTLECFMTPSAQATCDVFLPLATAAEEDGVEFAHYGATPVGTGFMNKAITVGECKTDMETCMLVGKRLNPQLWENYHDVYDFIDDLRLHNNHRFKDVCKEVYVQKDVEYYKYETGHLRKDGMPGFNTPTGRVELWSTMFSQFGDDPLPYYQEPDFSPVSTPELAKEYPFVLTTGAREYAFFHSENRQMPTMRELHPEPQVTINPKTAEKYGIEDGGWVEIENQFGHCREKAHVTPTVDPRVIHAQHGWWFPEQDGEAPNYYGVFKAQINNLMPHEHIGKLGLGAPYKCLLCKIRPVMGLDD